MSKITTEQQAIIDSIISQFESLNTSKPSGHRYIDISPILEMKAKVASERAVAQSIFSATLEAHEEILDKKYEGLKADLQVDGLTVSIYNQGPQKRVLMIKPNNGKEGCFVSCMAWGLQHKLSDGTNECIGIAPTYIFGGSIFNSFEELVSSDSFKSKITKVINSL